jgi:hypothetical protein
MRHLVRGFAVIVPILVASSVALALPAFDGYQDSARFPIRVHYPATVSAGDVATVVTMAESAWDSQVVGMGFPTPVTLDADGNLVEGLWIYVDPAGDMNSSVILGDNPRTPYTDCAVAVSISAIDQPGYLALVVPHEVNHALQMSLDCVESPFAYENTTVGVTTLGNPTDQLFTDYFLPPFQQNPHFGLDCTTWAKATYFYHYGAGLFSLFLEERYGNADGRLLVKVWEAARQDGTVTVSGMYPEADVPNTPDLLAAMSTVLAAKGVTFTDAFIEFTRWRYFVGANDDGQHFAHGAAWAGNEVALAASHALADLPLGPLQPEKMPADYGSVYVSLDLAGLEPDKVVTLAFEGATEVGWSVDAIKLRRGGPATIETMTLDPTRRGQLVLGDLVGADRMVFVFSNLSDGQHDSNNPACDSRVTMTYSLAVAAAKVPPLVQQVDRSLLELGSSVYLWVYGLDLRDGAQVAFSGSGVTVESVDFIDPATLGVTVAVAGDATPGPRDLTVTNPDGLSATLSAAVTLVDTSAHGGGCAAAASGGGGFLLALATLALLLTRRRGGRDDRPISS